MRKIININDSWLFSKEEEINLNGSKSLFSKDVVKPESINLNTSDFSEVNVPHTWNAIDGANGFEYYKGACWYRKELRLSPNDTNNRIFIEFEGSNSVTDVYVNEVHVGQHRGGYSTFRFDITDHVNFDKTNTLAIKVDNTIFEDVYPQMADFTFFGGIYRDVNIVIVNPVHIDLMDFGSTGVYITPKTVSEDSAELSILTKISNQTDDNKNIKLWIDILDENNNVVTYGASDITVDAKNDTDLYTPIVISNPTLWNGQKNPYLYTAKISIISFNDVIDEVIIPFGVRNFNVDPKTGFHLNGKHYPLNGVSRHQDRKDIGWAITEDEHTEDMELIKEIGATSIRLAHYQHDQFFYDLADKEGMVLWAEIPFISIMSKTELEGINPKLQLTELIKQNYNHPSIMFWGVQNEIQIGGERPEVRKLVSELNDLAHELDPTRLSTMANMLVVPNDDPYNTVTDVLGFNHYFGWYQGKTEDFADWIDGFHAHNPEVSLCISEYGAEGIIEYHNDDPKVMDYSETYHTLYHEIVQKIFADRPFLWATYAWNMFDFGANIRDEGGVKGRNNKGLVTYDRKIKKDAFYMYKANWSNDKFAHITSKRYVDRTDEEISVKVYSNCDQVTLFVNNNEVETLKVEDAKVIFNNVKLQDGVNTLKVVADDKFEDIAIFNKVDEANPKYVMSGDATGLVADNWFEMPEVGTSEPVEFTITDDVYSTECTIGELLDNAEAVAVIESFLGDFASHPMLGMAKGMKLSFVAGMAKDIFTDQLLNSINAELTKIKKD